MKTLSIETTDIQELPLALKRSGRFEDFFTSSQDVADEFCNVPKIILDRGETYQFTQCTKICGQNVCKKVSTLLDHNNY